MPAAILCEGLIKTFPGRPPVEAVRGLDLTVNSGECFGLLGPNGAGKTTTLEILEGLQDPTSGRVELLGLNWNQHANTIRARIGISLQETRLADKLTIREAVMMFRSFYPSGMTADEAIARVSLEEKANTFIVKLSGGQRQRLAVACAIVGNPELLFLDEPTTGLDPQSRRQLWDIIKSFRDAGKTVMLTTHYMDEAERLCDRVAVVDQGKVIALGTPKDLIAKLGGQNIIEFSLEGESELNADTYSKLPSVTAARVQTGVYSLTVEEPHLALPALMSNLQRHNKTLVSLNTRHATLEDVFVNLTGRQLRDGN